jgi:hypothetical protein
LEAPRLFMPYRTLKADGSVEESFVEKDHTDTLQGPSGNKMALLTFSQGASRERARTSPSPAADVASPGNAPDCSSSSHGSPMSLFDPVGSSSLRTFPDYFPPTTDAISLSYSRRWPSSGFTTSPGVCWTADTSESPNVGGVSSSLPDVLVAGCAARFSLSPRAAAGILRRAEKRGRELPVHLRMALRALARSLPGSDTTVTRRTS